LPVKDKLRGRQRRRVMPLVTLRQRLLLVRRRTGANVCLEEEESKEGPRN
jgi:hypothetical protein